MIGSWSEQIYNQCNKQFCQMYHGNTHKWFYVKILPILTLLTIVFCQLYLFYMNVQHFLYWQYPQNIIVLKFSQHMHTCMHTHVHRYTQKWCCYNPVMNCYLSSVLYPPNFSFQVFKIFNIYFLLCSFFITHSHLPSSLLALLNQFSQRSLKIM